MEEEPRGKPTDTDTERGRKVLVRGHNLKLGDAQLDLKGQMGGSQLSRQEEWASGAEASRGWKSHKQRDDKEGVTPRQGRCGLGHTESLAPPQSSWEPFGSTGEQAGPSGVAAAAVHSGSREGVGHHPRTQRPAVTEPEDGHKDGKETRPLNLMRGGVQAPRQGPSGTQTELT